MDVASSLLVSFPPRGKGPKKAEHTLRTIGALRRLSAAGAGTSLLRFPDPEVSISAEPGRLWRLWTRVRFKAASLVGVRMPAPEDGLADAALLDGLLLLTGRDASAFKPAIEDMSRKKRLSPLIMHGRRSVGQSGVSKCACDCQGLGVCGSVGRSPAKESPRLLQCFNR